MRIELCGPLGVGKTTLAVKIAELTGWNLIREPVETHPFLEDFYKLPNIFSFEKNLFFLVDYLHQIKSRTDGEFIFDHSAVVHRSYAALNGAQKLEKPVFYALDRLIETEGPPDLLINLVCPNDEIIERIRKRGRSFEAGVDATYVAALNDEIQRQVSYVDHYMPVLNLDAARYDFENRPEDVVEVLDIIRRAAQPVAVTPVRAPAQKSRHPDGDEDAARQQKTA